VHGIRERITLGARSAAAGAWAVVGIPGDTEEVGGKLPAHDHLFGSATNCGIAMSNLAPTTESSCLT
jgi:hypothetical protein